MERDAKIDNLACWYKQLNAEAEAIRLEEKSLCERRKSKEKQAEQIKAFLSGVLDGQKLETSRNKISWIKSNSVNFTDEAVIPDIFKEELITVKIGKDEIKKAIKSGIYVPGAELIENNNIQIK